MKVYWKTIYMKFGGSYKTIVKVDPCCTQCITDTDKLRMNTDGVEHKYHLITVKNIGSYFSNANTDEVKKGKCDNNIVARFCSWCGAEIKFHEFKTREFNLFDLKECVTAFVDAIRRSLHFRLNDSSMLLVKESDIRRDVDLAFNNLLTRLDLKD